MQKQKVLVTGGGGYVGSALVPALLEKGHEVVVLDLFIYGEEVLDDHDRLTCVKGDIRDVDVVGAALEGCNLVIHLACISNDPSFELNPSLGRSINLEAFRPLVEGARDSGVSRFIYASSSSVYGVKEETNVHEDIALEPLTDYSKFKAECEGILAEYQTETFTTVTIRPATVCGYARRQRLDVIVNILTNLAFHNRKIKILGGKQLRPNIHIKDMVAAYLLLMEKPAAEIAGKIYNAGYENHSVEDLGKMVVEVIGQDVTIEWEQTNDNRSYHVSSQKIRDELGFVPKHTIKDAVKDLKEAFENNLLEDPTSNEMYVNIKRMQSINIE
jgi:nucleoside-diphosphate-sugar epimerase